MIQYQEFVRTHDPVNRENQRLLVAQAMEFEDADRAWQLLDIPQDAWTHAEAAECVMVFRKLLKSGKTPTIFSVQEELLALKRIDSFRVVTSVSGDGYVARCGWDDALRSVMDYHERRKRYLHLMQAAQRLGETTDLADWDDKTLAAAVALQPQRKLQTGAKASDIVREEVALIQSGEDRKGFIQIGLKEIDEKTDGFGPGQFVVIAGHPGEGKTSFADQLATHIAKTYGPVYFEELEMNLRELARRKICASTGRSMNNWTTDDLTLALEKASELENLYYECAGGKLDAFMTRIHRRMLLVPDTKAIFVDYMGLLQNFGRGHSDTSEASAVSDALKFIAQQYQVLVVGLQQPNRNVEGRPDKTPRMTDLRDSSKIAQDAHKILFLHRPARYGETASKYYVQCHILKDRQGRAGGHVELCWRPSVFRFELWSETTYKPQPKQVFDEPSTGPRHLKPEKNGSRFNAEGPQFEDHPMEEASEGIGDFFR